MNSDPILFIGGGILIVMFSFALPSLIADAKVAYTMLLQKWEDQALRELDEWEQSIWYIDPDEFDSNDWFEIEEEPEQPRTYPRRLRPNRTRAPIHWDWHRTR